LGATIGLLTQDPEHFVQGGASGDETAEIEALILQRNEAKKARNFAESDRIRDELKARNIVLEDGPGGTTWRKA